MQHWCVDGGGVIERHVIHLSADDPELESAGRRLLSMGQAHPRSRAASLRGPGSWVLYFDGGSTSPGPQRCPNAVQCPARTPILPSAPPVIRGSCRFETEAVGYLSFGCTPAPAGWPMLATPTGKCTCSR